MIKRVLFMCVVGLIIPISLSAVEVDWVSGNVTHSHLRGEWEEVTVGMELFTGDIIKTGISSEATLLDGDSEIFILENSTFTISEKYENDEKKSSFLLFLGRMKFKLARPGEAEPEIQTQTVNLTIRGTEFEIGSGYDGSTLVVLSEGVVSVRGNEKELLLAKGEGTEVPFGEEPTEKFDVMTKVISWDEWMSLSKESIKGNELVLLKKVLTKFEEIDSQIKEFEKYREDALKKKDEYIMRRDELAEQGKKEEATEYSKEAGLWGKRSIHSLVNIRFLALSAIGLYDMAEMIYNEVETPEKELEDTFEAITQIYRDIESKYIMAGDRERLEEKAKKKRGCRKQF
jgi:hypothetical protein